MMLLNPAAMPRASPTNNRIGSGVKPVLTDLIFDPQTSGGLLISLASEQAADCVTQLNEKGMSARIIGTVKDLHPDGFLDIV